MNITCRCCNLPQPEGSYYKAANNKYYDKICKSCKQLRLMTKRRNQKIRAISYKGNKCERCGREGSPAIFDFHHRDPTTKEDRLIGGLKSWSKILPELNKCNLLCACCHRDVHYNKEEIWFDFVDTEAPVRLELTSC